MPDSKHERDRLADPRFTNAVERILASYEIHGGINHIEGHNLPSNERVIEIIRNLETVLFPGYREQAPIGRRNATYVIGARCARIYEQLTGEVAKSLEHTARCETAGDTMGPEAAAERAAEIVMELFEDLPAIRTVLREDARAAVAGDPAARSMVDVLLSYPSMRAIGTYRIAHWLHKRRVPLIPRMMTEFMHSRTGIDIHPGARIGPGLFIDHGTGVVVGETSDIGSNCKLYQGVTLGALSVARHGEAEWEPAKRHPTLEDDVTVYAGATILGGDTVIGRGSIVGGNVWITRSVPPHTKVLLDPPTQSFREIKGPARKEPHEDPAA
ncbi:MAG: serine acetyltransferase [Myxococcales bacterium]